jgi:hypothetical protein
MWRTALFPLLGATLALAAGACTPEGGSRAPFAGTWVIKQAKGPGPVAEASGSATIDEPDELGGAAAPAPVGCESVPSGGACAGDSLRMCVGTRVIDWPCGAGGGFCVANKVAKQAMCIYPNGGDPCTELEGQSVCEDDVVLWCEEGVLKAADCTTVGKVCDFDPAQGFDACIPPP